MVGVGVDDTAERSSPRDRTRSATRERPRPDDGSLLTGVDPGALRARPDTAVGPGRPSIKFESQQVAARDLFWVRVGVFDRVVRGDGRVVDLFDIQHVERVP